MANKMLGKVVAGAALGGASLLVFAPATALADGGRPDGEHDKGRVLAEPTAVEAGHKVKLVEICQEAQEEAFVWSEVTGKVKLRPAEKKDREEGGRHGEDRERGGESWHGKGSRGEDEGSRGEEKDRHGKGSRGEHEGSYGEEENGSYGDERGSYEEGKQEDGGWGGGAADDASDEAKKKEEDERKKEEEAKKHEGEKKGEESGEAKEHERADEDEAREEKEFVYFAEVKIPWDTEPGAYELKGSCGEGELVVLPRGGVEAGAGGTGAGTDTGLAASGAGMLGAAALGGVVLMRRRRTNGSLV
ncbi:hypothetical protein E1091_03060 [Micromonospora fluostatini]|uniref:LPXTG cell wall anchor domain-containing protein n=1 Tax=Micromonospora fluostatini TaxID=1629071 RepID=A0ABY2DLF5_9ACTN|nr:hypothetical protein E1091_03060 [Micromonospora fluostatini]